MHKGDKEMAIIINFQEYANFKKKNENDVARKNISTGNGQIIYFNKEAVKQ